MAKSSAVKKYVGKTKPETNNFLQFEFGKIHVVNQ